MTEPITLTVAVALAAAGAGATRTFVTIAAQRAAAQPVDLAIDDEVALLAAVLDDPAKVHPVHVLRVDEFAVPAHRTIWDAIVATYTSHGNTLGDEPENLPGVAQWQTEVALAAAEHADVVAALVSTTADPATGGALTTDALVEHGKAIIATAEARTELCGAAGLLETDDPAAPYVRPAPTVSRRRVVATAVAIATGLAAAPLLAATATSGVAWAFATGALAILIVTGAILSLIDHDTMMIDLGTLGAGAGAAWTAAIVAAVASGTPGRLLTGVLAVVLVAAVFEGANLLYRKLRGRDGQGFGDTLLVVAVVGVPCAIAGSLLLAYAAVMAGMLLGLVGYALRAVRTGAGREVPFAFGPFLAAGWPLGWTVLLITGSI